MADSRNEKLQKVPPLTLILIFSSFIIVVIFIFGVLYPQYQKVKKVKKDRLTNQINLEKQRKLFPVYTQLKKNLDQEFDPQLPLTDRISLKRDNIGTLSDTFKKIAIEHNLNLSQHNLDIKSLKNESDVISMELKLSGELKDFRYCLISFVQQPFFNRFELIDITPDLSNKKQLTTKILLNIDKK